ncbi:hypothetical protein ASG65_27575 [Bacillus sp. Leaf13]|nr:hypothetical protein ASG65_27575 [Bacillus sp. Leaf13]
MDKELKQVKEQYKEHYYDDEISNRIKNKVYERILKDQRKWSLSKKFKFLGSVAVIILFLLVGSAFVSPAMAKVISHIPYLGSIFQSKSISSLIIDELEEKGYKISGTGINYKPKKELEVRVEGSDDYFNEVKDEIEKTVKGILKSKGYDAFSVKVSKELAQNDYVLNGEETKIGKELTKRLKQLDYKFDSILIFPRAKVININIDGSKEYYDAVKDDVEKTAIDVTELNNYKDYNIDVNRSTVKIAKADTGALITPAIAEGLMSKKEFKVTGVGYKEKPLSFIISTSIPSSDSEAKALGTEIESMIVEFLKSEEISLILGNESYEIIVKSKDKKKIN